VPLLQSLLEDEPVRLTAIKGLAAYDDPNTPKLILKEYPHLTPTEKGSAISTLSSRANYAVALLESVRAGAIPARDISPFAARQIQAYEDPRLEPLLKDLGSFRGVSGEKKAQIAKYKTLLTPAALEKADLSHGRELFQRTCSACHTLFDEGGKLAPELTGAQRSNLDYLLDNVVDPNAVVWDQYKATYFETKDDQLISGVVVRENESTVTIQTPTGVITVPRNEITSRRKSELSLMPEGLLDGLQEKEVIDLVAYLQSPAQVPLKK
jgi:putative heme-binding domain-containing protein